MEENYDRERWRGSVDARMDNMAADIASSHAKADKLDAKLQLTNLEVRTIATKIGLWAAGGAVIGGGVVSMVFRLLMGK